MANHRSGKLKQTNKKHKIPGSTKGSKDQRVQGRVAARAGGKKATNNTPAGSKQQRLNRQKQLMQEKRQALIRQKRRGGQAIPHIVSVLCLHSGSKMSAVAQALRSSDVQVQALSGQDEADTMEAEADDCLRYDVICPAQKKSFSLLHVETSDILGALDKLSVSEAVVIIVEHDGFVPRIDEAGRRSLELLAAYGSVGLTLLLLPSGDTQGSIHSNKSYKSYVDSLPSLFPMLSELKIIHALDSSSWVQQLAEQCKHMRWRQQRSYLLSDRAAYHEEDGTLHVYGALRGVPMFIHSLLHIGGLGVGSLQRVLRFDAEGNVVETICADQDKQDALQSEPEGNNLQGEQTWPEDNEMQPNHSLSIQHDAEEVAEGDEEEGEEDGEESLYNAYFNNQLEETSAAPAASNRPLRVGKSIKETEEDVNDEYVDVPGEVSARARFARYRSLRSFKSSFWHSRENLPPQYSRIFQLEDCRSLQRSVSSTVEQSVKQQQLLFSQRPAGSKSDSSKMDAEQHPEEAQSMALNEDYLKSDQFVELVISGLDAKLVQQHLSTTGALTVFALHANEYKRSVCHFNVQRMACKDESILTYNGLVRSKDLMLFHNGFRSYWTKPIYSESNLNCDKHKYLRSWPKDGFHVASCIGPMSMCAQEPLLVLRPQEGDRDLQLVGRGALMSIDPDRIMLKKVILTGTPIRVRKRFAVVRHMFYDPMDIKWFKPAELATAHGLRGHITCSVGTHGLFKALFSAPITQNDTVMLILYKRVYPKIPDSDAGDDNLIEGDEEEEEEDGEDASTAENMEEDET